jgi:hypothetical protein
METIESIKLSRNEYERLMKTLKKLGLNPNIEYRITEKGRERLNYLSLMLNYYDRSLFGRRRAHIARKEDVQAKVLSILEKIGPTNLLNLKSYLNKEGQRLYYKYVADMIDAELITPAYRG